MPITADDVLPQTETERAAPGAPAETAESAIPDEVLEIPVVYGLLRGSPAAISVPKGFKSPETAVIGKHAQALNDAGLSFYDSDNGDLRVLFNTAYVSPQQLAQADEAGTLGDVTVPFEQAKAEFGGGGAPAPSAAGAPAAPSPGAPPSSASQKKLTTARVNNLQLGSPTSGPAPGAGRILNNILKPTV